MHTVLLSKQIGHYHDARYRGAASALERLTVLSVVNQGGFAEFLAKDTGAYAIEKVFADKQAYTDAASDGSIFRAVEDKLNMLKPDVIVLSGWAGPESMVAILWARENRIPLVMMSESQIDDAARSTLREVLKGRIVQACDAGFVGGPSHKEYMVKLGMPADRIHLGYNAVDNAHFEAASDEARADEVALRIDHNLPQRYVLASARFIEKKNLPALVGAFGIARSTVDGAPELVILGDGETRGDIDKAIADAGLEGLVHMPGFRGYDALPIYYALSEGFLHVSTVEQWGLVVNEAMASGVPVVVSNRCGVARTVVRDGVDGFLVDPFNTNDMAAALTKMFSLSNAERNEMGAHARTGIAPWGPARYGEGVSAAVQSAIAALRKGGLAPWDKFLLKRMTKQVVETVA